MQIRKRPGQSIDTAVAAVSPATRHRLGRPPLPSEVTRSERVVTFVTREEKQELEVLAATASQSLSAICHHLIVRGLRRETQRSDRRKGRREDP